MALSLPKYAQQLLNAWRESCPGDGLPILEEFAPFKIPPSIIPFSMIYRRVSSSRLEYGVVGDELDFLFKTNPVGKQVLAYASEIDRESRYSIIFKAFDERRPFWFSGSVLFKSTQLDFGRLGLPMQAKLHQSLLIVYFPTEPLPTPRPTDMITTNMEKLNVTWL